MRFLLRHIADCIAATLLAITALPALGSIVYVSGYPETGIAILNLSIAIYFAPLP